MAKFIIAVVTLLVLQGSWAKPKGKQSAQQSPLEELAHNTETLVNNVTQTLGIKELPDSKKVVEVLNTQTQSLANHFEEFINKLKTESKAHQGEIDNVIRQVQEKITEANTKLQQAVGPDAVAKAKDLKKNLDDGLKTAVAQADKLAKAVEPDATKAKAGIESAIQNFFHQISDVSTNLDSQFKATLAEHEKTHKH